MMSETKWLSKLMSLALRHRPEHLGIELDAGGWTEVDALLAALRAKGKDVDRDLLEQVVRGSDKQRFAFSGDGSRIRAQQGHSVPIDLGLEPLTPPEVLYHGTVDRFLDPIRREGLVKKSRHHVHLSSDVETATTVGGRRGAPVLLVIDAAGMHAAGHAFYRSGNGVWLTGGVPVRYITFPAE